MSEIVRITDPERVARFTITGNVVTVNEDREELAEQLAEQPLAVVLRRRGNSVDLLAKGRRVFAWEGQIERLNIYAN